MSDNPHKHLHIRFFKAARENKRRSKEEGRPIYDDIEMVEIKFAGDNKNVHVAPAHAKHTFRQDKTLFHETYAVRFPEHYAAFKKGDEVLESGTPLSEAPFLTEGRREELRRSNVFTVEALAGLDGALLQKLGMDARDLKNKAQAYLDSASAIAQVSENSELRKKLEALEKQLADMAAGGAKEGARDEAPASTSPFADWADEDIAAWLSDNGVERPHHRTGRPKLLALADARNAELKAEAEKAKSEAA